jgi:hypothetical protein
MVSLELIREAKLHRLLPGCDGESRLEASGVVAREGELVDVFDNLNRVAALEPSLSPSGRHGWLGHDDEAPGFEDIAYDADARRYYALIEAMPAPGDIYRAAVVEYDAGFNRQEAHRLPFDFDSENKGIEGLAYLRRDGDDYLLALCEGNGCRGGREGRRPGNCRIQIFRRDGRGWTHAGSLYVPAGAHFVDYAGLDVRDGQVAMISQASSKLWIGAFASSGWGFVDEGIVYLLPLDANGDPIYCDAEGVAWLAPDRVAVASDRRKPDEPERCRHKQQSLHIFGIPWRTGEDRSGVR